jgi:hypothetical protein
LEASGLGQSPEARALRKKEWEFIGSGSLATRLWDRRIVRSWFTGRGRKRARCLSASKARRGARSG